MSDNLKKFNRNKSIPSNPPKQNKVYVVSFSDSSSGEDDNDNNYHQKLQTYSVKTYGNVKTDPRKLNYNNVQTSQRNQGYTAYQNIPMNIPNQNFFTMRNPVQVPNLRYNYYVSPITSNYAFPSTQNYNIDTYNRSLSGSNMNSNGNYSRAYYPLDVSFGNISGNVSGSIQNNMINPNPTVIPYQRPQSISFRSPNIKTYQSPVFNFKSKIPYAMDQIYSNKTQKDKNAIKIQKVVRGYNLRKNLYEYLARYMNQQALYKQQQQIPYQTQTLNSTSNYRQNYNIGINPNVQSYNPNQKFDSYSFGHTNYDLIGNNVSQNNITNQRTIITNSKTEENINKNNLKIYNENFQKEIDKNIINNVENNTIKREEINNDTNNLRSKPKKTNNMTQTSNDRYKQYNSENNQDNTNKPISHNVKPKEIKIEKVYETSKIYIENNSPENSNKNIKNEININYKNKKNDMINKNLLKNNNTCNYDKNDPC